MPGKSSETAEHALTGGARVPIIDLVIIQVRKRGGKNYDLYLTKLLMALERGLE